MVAFNLPTSVTQQPAGQEWQGAAFQPVRKLSNPIPRIQPARACRMASALAAWQSPTNTSPRLSAAKPATSMDTSASVSSGVSSSATSSFRVPAGAGRRR